MSVKIRKENFTEVGNMRTIKARKHGNTITVTVPEGSRWGLHVYSKRKEYLSRSIRKRN